MTLFLSSLRQRVVDATNDLFAHAPYPLDGTGRYRGDPGLFGPDSVTWLVVGDAAVFVGGIRALLVQAAHPEVVAGVFEVARRDASITMRPPAEESAWRGARGRGRA